jgi:putative ABC transport system ATP-binding protein
MTKGPIIAIHNLRKTFRLGELDVHALRGVDLEVQTGEFVAIIGPSGSGKSTLFNILGGLASASEGSVLVDGQELSGLSETQLTEMRRRLVGFVFQKYNLLPTLNAEDNIRIAQVLAGRNNFDEPAFQEILGLLNIKGRLHHKPRSMSGGEQQRVAIARALVNQPALLLADEPTGNLDSENSEAVLRILKDLNKRLGQTILMITHNPEAAEWADRTIRMRDGRVVS